MTLARESKKAVIDKYSQKDGDTGSPEVQAALLTERIKYLTEHFKIHKKDHHSRVGLTAMIEKRKKLLNYLKSNYQDRYKSILEKLEIRK